ncbi:hypothetical protein J3E69DRAFT_346245 [Trichoderma sp. SZMC 28015]
MVRMNPLPCLACLESRLFLPSLSNLFLTLTWHLHTVHGPTCVYFHFISCVTRMVALHSMGRFETAQPVNPRFGHCRTTSWRTSRPCSERELLVLGQGWCEQGFDFCG